MASEEGGCLLNPQANDSEYILITGGLGFIGSHTVLQLVRNNEKCLVLDNLSNCSIECLNRLVELTERQIEHVNADLTNLAQIEHIFSKNKIKAVIHFAGYKSVGESVAQPLKYYENNILGTINLLRTMKKFEVKTIVFSSSATVYGTPQELPISEDHPAGDCANPYGRCKYFIEEILRDLANTHNDWKISILRYFNPIGADSSGLIGEDPKGIPNNLLPYITQVAVGRIEHLNVFGSDYPTTDGTGVRDYVHVVDLAYGHLKALHHVRNSEKEYFQIFNLGTGKGFSVLEVVKAFETVSHKKIPLKMVEKRKGDVATCFADASKAKRLLSWECKYSLEDMCRDAWNWQVKNPTGFTKTD